MNAIYMQSRRLNMSGVLEALVVFGLCSSLVLPSLSLLGIGVYFTTIVSVLLFVFVSFGLLALRPVVHFSVLPVFIMSIMVLLISIVSWGLSLSDYNIRDLNESVKYAQFIPYLLTLSYIRPERFQTKLLYGIHISLCLLLVVGYIQIFAPISLLKPISMLYLSYDSVHLLSVISGSRVTLTGTNPNVGGFIAAYFSIYVLVRYLHERNILYLILFFLVLFLVLKTQSRTVLVAMTISFFLYFMFVFRLNIIKKIILLALIFVLSTALVSFVNLDYVTIGFQLAISGENNSVNVRLENLLLAYDRFLQSPIIGWGPAKSEFSTGIDSEYALILQRYGLVGILVFGGTVIYMLRTSLKNIHTIPGSVFFLVVIMTVIVMSTNNVFSGYQLMSILIMLLMWNIVFRKIHHNAQ